MPRYRFSWDNLPPGLLGRLGQDLSLPDPVEVSLRARYGARPKPEFVRDAWPTLLQAWLPQDDGSRERAVRELQGRRLGDAAAPTRTMTEQLDYLRSCRNSTSLREVIAGIFTAFGEPTSLRTPVPSRSGPHAPDAAREQPEPQTGTDAAGKHPANLDEWLGWAVATILGKEEAPRDPDGDIPIRSGSTMCYIRSVDDPPSLRLFSPMVVEVPRTPGLLDALNEINMQISVGRVFHTPANEVVFALELYGEQLTVEIIGQSLAAATAIADHFDHQIQSRFGGKTLFAEMSDDSVMV